MKCSFVKMERIKLQFIICGLSEPEIFHGFDGR